ncbi:MAG TPA: tRNA lysidine(34) synthetase TilS, partial [Calditrichaeota bacterium]|nr:tRNA lysidine(34) synthetase TilS [Calditrichota bacterium]
ELIGLETFKERENYTLIRPLLEYSKDELLFYLPRVSSRGYKKAGQFGLKPGANKLNRKFNRTLLT